jgi:hypothetical protein
VVIEGASLSSMIGKTATHQAVAANADGVVERIRGRTSRRANDGDTRSEP